MAVQTCKVCRAPFFYEGNIGAKTISVNKVCDCAKVPVEPMADAVRTLEDIRDFQKVD